HTGLAALLFSVPDHDDAAATLEAAGRPVTRTEQEGRPVLLTTDPDGTRLEVFEVPQPPTYRGVRINATDLERSVAFYTAVFELDSDKPRVIKSGDQRFRGQRMYIPRQRETFSIELTQWLDPPPTGMPYTKGNHAGIYRLAAAVDDMRAAYDELLKAVPDA